MDLKALLVEAKQKVPPVLQVLQTGDETMLDIGGEPLFTSGESVTCVYASVNASNTTLSRVSRREGLYLLWWSGSSYHGLSEAGGHADQAGLQSWAERLPGS